MPPHQYTHKITRDSAAHTIICMLSAFFAPWTVDSRGVNAQGESMHCVLRSKCEWVWCNLWLTNGAKTVTMLKDYDINVAYIICICSYMSNMTTEETFKGRYLIFCTQDKMYCMVEHFTKLARDCASYIIRKLQNLDIEYKERF